MRSGHKKQVPSISQSKSMYKRTKTNCNTVRYNKSLFKCWQVTIKIILGSETGLTYKDKRILDAQTWGSVEKSFHLSSNGWYFRGDNQLEIIGGPNLTDGEPDFSNLKIIRKEKKEKKQNSLTPKPSRKSNVRRSRSVSTWWVSMIRINHAKVGDSRHYYHGMNHVRISLSEIYSVFVYLLF